VSTQETREMRLITRLIETSKRPEHSLAEFIAKRRAPGKNWRSWEGVSIDLHEATGEVFGIASLRSWAHIYGIPESTRPYGTNLSPEDYAAKLAEAGIKVKL
jgi:hypothetical protein